jgi:hypothetical protein
MNMNGAALIDPKTFMLTDGTGKARSTKINTGIYPIPRSTVLPMYNNDYDLLGDQIQDASVPYTTMPSVDGSMLFGNRIFEASITANNGYYAPKTGRVVGIVNGAGVSPTKRGFSSTGNGRYTLVFPFVDNNPKINGIYLLSVINGEIYLVVMTTPNLRTILDGTGGAFGSVDLYKLAGRPLMK